VAWLDRSPDGDAAAVEDGGFRADRTSHFTKSSCHRQVAAISLHNTSSQMGPLPAAGPPPPPGSGSGAAIGPIATSGRDSRALLASELAVPHGSD
jgi:hypothetical protein